MKTSQPINSISPAALQSLLESGPGGDLIDVRTPAEYAGVHVRGAQLIPLDQLDPASLMRSKNSTVKNIYVLCESGGRATRAVEKFRKCGLDCAVLVEGGMQAWVAAGLPVERGAQRVLPLMRQVQVTVGIISATGAALALWVNPLFAIIPLITGCGLLFAGVTGFCGLALVLAKMPWNRAGDCAGCCGPARGEQS